MAKMLPNPGPTPHRGVIKKTSSPVVSNPKPKGADNGLAVPKKNNHPVVSNPKPNPTQTKAGVRKGK